jgi:GNAT superfamily N-acetyltransferase
MTILQADPADASLLTEIAFAAKRSWGYPESWIQQWKDVLTITSEYLVQHPAYVASIEGRIMGFYVLHLNPGNARLEHLWVIPNEMKKGIGRALFRHAEETSKTAGIDRMEIEADPNAEGFYARMGATTVGRVRSVMDHAERILPIMEKKLDPNAGVYRGNAET